MKYKLLALDLDGTLIMRDHTIAPETAKALREIIEGGGFVTLSTGRAFPTGKMYAQELNINIPLLVYNGSQIRDCTDGGFFLERGLPLQKMEMIIDYCRVNGLFVQYYNNDRVIVEKATERALRDPDLTICGYTEVGDFKKYERKVSPKMLVVDTPERGALIAEDMKRKFGDIMYIAQSAKSLVEVMDKGVSKGSSLEILCSHLGITPEETVSCGDSINDMEIIKRSGIGAAMGNACAKLKSAADYICEKECSYGVLEVVEKFFGDYL